MLASPGLFRQNMLTGPLAASSIGLVLGLVAFGAAGFFLGQPNPLLHIPLLVLAFPLALFLLALSAPSNRRAFGRCWLLGLAGNAAGIYWLVNPMHDVGGLGYGMAVPAMLLAAAYLGCYPALAGLCMRQAGKLCAFPRQISPEQGTPCGSSLPRLVAVAFLAGASYGGCEIACGVALTGFPWLSLSTSFALQPAWVQAASLIGSYGLSALFAFAACLIAAALLAPCRKKSAAALLLALSVLASLQIYGRLRLESPLPEVSDPPLTVVMVQGNIDQSQKWLSPFQETTIDRYLALSGQALGRLRAEQPPREADLVIWPETAMPFYFQAQPEYRDLLRSFAARNNVNLAFGTLGYERSLQPTGGRNLLFNRMYLLSVHGAVAGLYDKQHLVPFGEYIPFASFLDFLQNILQGLDFSPGRPRDPLRLIRPRPKPSPLDDAPLPTEAGTPPVSTPFAPGPGQEVPLGALICYEAIFPSLAQQSVEKGARALINISNDGWFGKSSAPLQHLGLTAMRAVEQARPIARATNTGYTATIDSKGRITARGERLFVTDSLASVIEPCAELTLYHRLHPVPEIMLILLAIFSLFGYLLPRAKRC